MKVPHANKKRSRDLHEAVARLITPKSMNRKQRRRFEQRICNMRSKV